MEQVRLIWLGVLIMGTFLGASCAVGKVPDVVPAAKEDIPLTGQSEQRKAVLASGCFWCTEAVFQQIPGVMQVVSGYAGDTKETANYEAVCSHQTNHAECVQVTYDASKVTYGRLLQAFFSSHDPTTLNRQGPDEGRQYRSAIFYGSEEEKRVAGAYIKQLDEAKVFGDAVVTSLEKLTEFYPAETYHQNYARSHPFQPYIERYALPKAAKAKKNFGTTQPAH